MRRASFLIVSAAVLAVAAACGGGPATTPGPGGTSASGGPTVGTPTPGGPVGNSCAGTPTPNPAGSPQPVIPRDPDLEALYPSEIDGVPIEELVSYRWLAYLCFFQGQSAVDDILANVPGGIDPNLSYANALVWVDDEGVSLDAFRTPGQDAGLMVQNFAQLILILGGDLDDNQGTMASASIGGKNAFVWTQEDGDKSYLYPRGDVLFGMTDVTEEQAGTIFAALP